MKPLLVAALFALADAHLNAHLSDGLLPIAITRHHKGDVFAARGGRCLKDFCQAVSGGTAAPTGKGQCECRCEESRPVFREDLGSCVDDIEECSLVPFASGSVRRRIPYVFLPLKGQIVNPSAEMVVPGEEAPVCVVSGGEYLGRSGWVKLRNSSGAESPFRVFRDEGRTYLQWLGEGSLRMAMEGRIMVVHLMCKDASAAGEPRVFTPCVGFRVAGKASAKEMTFGTEVELREEDGGGLSVREYVALGICCVVLGVVYVAGVALYLYVRRRKRQSGSAGSGKGGALTLGEEGVVKSNPLLQAARHLSPAGHDNAGYVSESNSCCSDTDQTSDLLCLDDDDLLSPQNMQTAAIVHPCDLDYGDASPSQDPNSIEKLPEENVSIVETLEAREHPETLKGMACGNGRRKLYFNPSYLEPDLLKAPPPAAIEFLVKIREVIAIAKHKMSAKKFSPSLLGIPEEDSASRADHSSSLCARKPAAPAAAPLLLPTPPGELCWPSDAKQKIIRKWLEDVPVMMVEAEDCGGQRAPQEEGVPSPPARQERRKAKGRAPTAPPAAAADKRESPPAGPPATPPRPPPMPTPSAAAPEAPRLPGKDCVPPAVARSLMDAVIEELTNCRREGRRAREGWEETWQEKRGRGEGGEGAEGEGEGVGVQDDHEYEIILLNSEECVGEGLGEGLGEGSGEGKDMKIYNLPELLSKSERTEGYSLVSEVYVNDGYSCCSGESPGSSWGNLSVGSEQVHYDVPSEKPGRLTIHVNDSPERYKAAASDSDNFEPDTLDRKPRRQRPPPTAAAPDDAERYSNQKFHDMESHLSSPNSDNFTDSLERPRIMLTSNGTFNRTPLDSNGDDLLRNFSWNRLEGFGSLREIYEAKTRHHSRRKHTNSLIDSPHTDHDRVSTLSWGEDKRHRLLDRGIVLHITHDTPRRHNRPPRRQPKPVAPPKVPSRPPKPPHSPTPAPHSPSRTPPPPLPPPRSIPPSPSPQPAPRSTTSSPAPAPAPAPRPHNRPPTPPVSPSPPPRPPKTTKPPLPPKHPKRHPHPANFAARPLPPLPRPPKHPPSPLPPAPSHHDPLYTLPYGPPLTPTPTPTPPHKPRPEDSGYLSTDSDSCCPPPTHPRLSPPHNSETDDSLCDGASESGGESIATDSFFYGNFPPNAPDDAPPRQLRPCALRLSDLEPTPDADRRSLPIMVSP